MSHIFFFQLATVFHFSRLYRDTAIGSDMAPSHQADLLMVSLSSCSSLKGHVVAALGILQHPLYHVQQCIQ